MTDTHPDCVPVKNESLEQKEKEGTVENQRASTEMLPLTAVHALPQSLVSLCVMKYGQVFLILKIKGQT